MRAMTHRTVRLAAALALGLAALPLAAQQRIDTAYFYRITNDLKGPDQALSVVNGGWLDNAAQVEQRADVSSQYWRIDIAPGGTVALSTMFRGPAYCLDIVPEGARVGEVDLRSCTGGESQRWRMVQEGARFQLKTTARGGEECLEVIPEGLAADRLRLNICGFYANQLWSFAVTDQPVK